MIFAICFLFMGCGKDPITGLGDSIAQGMTNGITNSIDNSFAGTNESAEVTLNQFNLDGVNEVLVLSRARLQTGAVKGVEGAALAIKVTADGSNAGEVRNYYNGSIISVENGKLTITLGDRYVYCIRRESGSGRRGTSGVCPTAISIAIPRGLVVRYHSGPINRLSNDPVGIVLNPGNEI